MGVASLSTVRVVDGATLLATHPRCFDKGVQVEDPAHIAALVARKHQARQHRGTDRLVRAAPHSRALLSQAAERGENLGTLTAALLRLLERCDAPRRPQRFRELLLACQCDARGRAGRADDPYPQRERLSAALDAVLAADTAAASRQALAEGLQGPAIGQRVHAARLAALAQALDAGDRPTQEPE